MRGIAFIGGEKPSPEFLRKIVRGADIIAAADSGLAAAEDAGIKSDFVIGDMDSLDSPERLKKYPSARVFRFPHEKDSSDTELACALLREKGCDEIWLAGGGGGRIDHLFAIASLFEREDCPDRWFPGSAEIICLKDGGTLMAPLPVKTVISIFPLGNGGWSAESRGLKWPLNGLAWEHGKCSLSNETSETSLMIRSLSGRFMVITHAGLFDNAHLLRGMHGDAATVGQTQ